jgi:hypothetical protein
MNAMLIDTLLSLIPTAFKLLYYEQEQMMDPNTVFQQCFDWFVIKYGCTLAGDCKTNWMAMWLPTGTFQWDLRYSPHTSSVALLLQASQATLSQTRTWATLAVNWHPSMGFGVLTPLLGHYFCKPLRPPYHR